MPTKYHDQRSGQLGVAVVPTLCSLAGTEKKFPLISKPRKAMATSGCSWEPASTHHVASGFRWWGFYSSHHYRGAQCLWEFMPWSVLQALNAQDWSYRVFFLLFFQYSGSLCEMAGEQAARTLGSIVFIGSCSHQEGGRQKKVSSQERYRLDFESVLQPTVLKPPEEA